MNRYPLLLSAAAIFAIPALILHSSPASAQWLGPQLDAQRYDNLRRHQQRIQQKRQQQRKAATQPLTPHQRACAQRYRSYDAATNTYQVRPGVRARCRL